MTETMARVICAACGWRGHRKTGQIVTCPCCGMIATYEVDAIRDQAARRSRRHRQHLTAHPGQPIVSVLNGGIIACLLQHGI